MGSYCTGARRTYLVRKSSIFFMLLMKLRLLVIFESLRLGHAKRCSTGGIQVRMSGAMLPVVRSASRKMVDARNHWVIPIVLTYQLDGGVRWLQISLSKCAKQSPDLTALRHGLSVCLDGYIFFLIIPLIQQWLLPISSPLISWDYMDCRTIRPGPKIYFQVFETPYDPVCNSKTNDLYVS